MILTKPRLHLLDVNIALALLDQDHIHHEFAEDWFSTPNLRWAICSFTEAGVLRLLLRQSATALTFDEVAAMLQRLKEREGYHYQAISADWHTLTEPFRKRLHGHNQVTDAFLLGLAVHEGLVLTTFDKAILHMAAEHKRNVLVLEP